MAGIVNYDQFEILNVDLSNANDELTIENNTDAGETTVEAGAGDDTLTANLTMPVGEAIFVASGQDGNDTLNAEGSTSGVVLNGNDGEDTVLGGSANDLLGGGEGNDNLFGYDGNDTYYWAHGDGNDYIRDTNPTGDDLNTLVLTDVLPGEVELGRFGTNPDMRVRITDGSTTSDIWIESQFQSSSIGDGLQAIVFSDGTSWSHMDIAQNTWLIEDGDNNSRTGLNEGDNIDGDAGNDTLKGGNGDDVLKGSAGNDRLEGQQGSDTYLWAVGDGNDTIIDNPGFIYHGEIDRLVLTDTTSDNVSLERSDGSDNLRVKILSTGEEITINDTFNATYPTRGIEEIAFSDGVVWRWSDIEAQTKVIGGG